MIFWICFGIILLLILAYFWHDAGRKGSANIIGALRQCTKDDWWRAFNELAVTLIFGLFPVWVPYLLHLMIGDHGWTTILSQVDEGQLFFVATALLAPIFYFTFPSARHPNGHSSKPFPSQQILIAVFIGTVIASALAVSILDFPMAMQGGEEGSIKDRMIFISLGLFIFASIFYFLSLVVRNWLDRGGVETLLDQNARETDRNFPPPDRGGGGTNLSPEDMVNRTIAAARASRDNQ